jgi:hypothetical protein
MSKKMCKQFKKGLSKEDWKAYKDLIKNPKVVCKNCGRVAAKASEVCKPEKL